MNSQRREVFERPGGTAPLGANFMGGRFANSPRGGGGPTGISMAQPPPKFGGGEVWCLERRKRLFGTGQSFPPPSPHIVPFVCRFQAKEKAAGAAATDSPLFENRYS